VLSQDGIAERSEIGRAEKKKSAHQPMIIAKLPMFRVQFEGPPRHLRRAGV